MERTNSPNSCEDNTDRNYCTGSELGGSDFGGSFAKGIGQFDSFCRACHAISSGVGTVGARGRLSASQSFEFRVIDGECCTSKPLLLCGPTRPTFPAIRSNIFSDSSLIVCQRFRACLVPTTLRFLPMPARIGIVLTSP